MNSNSVKEFERRCAQEREKGLVDLKFCTDNMSDATPDSFCQEANSIDEAMERGDVEEFRFNDSYRNS